MRNEIDSTTLKRLLEDRYTAWMAPPFGPDSAEYHHGLPRGQESTPDRDGYFPPDTCELIAQNAEWRRQRGIPQIEVLELPEQHRIPLSGWAHLRSLAGVRVLNVSQNAITHAELAHFTYIPNLQELDISECANIVSIEPLFDAWHQGWRSLKRLVLWGNLGLSLSEKDVSGENPEIIFNAWGSRQNDLIPRSGDPAAMRSIEPPHAIRVEYTPDYSRCRIRVNTRTCQIWLDDRELTKDRRIAPLACRALLMLIQAKGQILSPYDLIELDPSLATAHKNRVLRIIKQLPLEIRAFITGEGKHDGGRYLLRRAYHPCPT